MEPFLHLNMAISVQCGRQGHTFAPRCPEEKSYGVAGPMLKLAMIGHVFTVLPQIFLVLCFVAFQHHP